MSPMSAAELLFFDHKLHLSTIETDDVLQLMLAVLYQCLL